MTPFTSVASLAAALASLAADPSPAAVATGADASSAEQPAPPAPPAAERPIPGPQFVRLQPPEPLRPPFFLDLRLGGFLPTDDLAILGPDWKSGYDLEVGFGLRLSDRVAAEVSVGRYRARSTDEALFSSTRRDEIDLAVTSICGTLRLSLAARPSADFYLLAGLGAYLGTIDVQDTQDGVVLHAASRTVSPLGYHLGFGLAVALGRHVALGAEVKYAAVSGRYTVLEDDPQRYRLAGLRGAIVLGFRF